ncbi:hypothetical protein GW17_00023006, partial [Ensete ventricosum]
RKEEEEEVEMKVVVGSPGTWSGLLLRTGQCVFAGASIGVMVSALGFSNYTAFWYRLVTATLSLAAACSSAGVTVLFARDVHFCRTIPQFSCGRFEISVAFAFVTWLLISLSSLVMFWLLASV